MKPYFTLTVRGRARRLRTLALNALALYDLDVTRLRLVTNDMNGIFRLDTRDGNKYILRVTAPEGAHRRDDVAAEMAWLAALARDTTLSVPRPLPARDGSLVVETAAPGVPEPRWCVIFSWVPGQNLAEAMTEPNVARLGELMARLHAHALTYHPPATYDLLHYDRVFPFDEPVVLFDERHAALFTPERYAIYRQAIAWAQDSIDRLKASGEPMRLLHGDLHQWNVRLARGVLSPIDFEDLMMGWPVQDIATTLYYFPRETFPALRAAFQDGYARHSPWPERHCPWSKDHGGEIDSFIAARAVCLANFVLNDPNPEWQDGAAGFLDRTEMRLRRLMGQ